MSSLPGVVDNFCYQAETSVVNKPQEFPAEPSQSAVSSCGIKGQPFMPFGIRSAILKVHVPARADSVRDFAGVVHRKKC